ncbi:DUF1624 domain-containing protein [Microbacteriaceae bacterium VKM Ac-2855]|nr:DUF1624 domain-containing protein [Microbacteriaceae bacterium VKM Ac-2855]
MTRTWLSASGVSVAPRRQSDRSVVLDVSRGVAIVAMLIAHAGILLQGFPTPLAFTEKQINDLASPLFALTMGAAASIVIARAGRAGYLPVVAQNIVRGVILIALGYWTATWGSWISIVLAPLGLTLLLGTPLLRLSTRALAVVLMVILVVGAPVNATVAAIVIPAPLGDVSTLLFTHPNYRVTNLLPMFLLGALLQRIDFGGARLARIMIPVGIALFGVEQIFWRFVPGYTRVSGNFLDTVHDLGLVLTVVGVIGVAASLRAPGAARVIGAVFVPLRAAGSVALSLYVLQVGVVAGLARTGWVGATSNVLGWLILVVGLPSLAYLWWRFIGKGPLEWAIGLVSGRYRIR